MYVIIVDPSADAPLMIKTFVHAHAGPPLTATNPAANRNLFMESPLDLLIRRLTVCYWRKARCAKALRAVRF